MKYTICSVDSEKVLAIVDTIDGKKVSIKLEAKNSREIEFKDLAQTMRKVRAIPYFRRNGQVVFSSALGQVSVIVIRGMLEAETTGGARATKTLKSSMPGKIVRLLCKPGDKVEIGQPLLIIEAMKMESEIKAAYSGIVDSVSVEAGSRVEAGAVLIKFK